MIVEAGVQNRLPIGVRGKSGQRNRETLMAVNGCRAADGPQHLVAVHPGHGEIADEHIERLRAPVIERLESRARLRDRCACARQRLRRNLAAVGIVVDDENRVCRQGWAARIASDRATAAHRRSEARKRQREAAAVSAAGARRFQHASMQLADLLGDGETEAQAAVLPRRRLIGLAKALEDMRQKFGRNPDAGVGDDDGAMPVVSDQLDGRPCRQTR